MSRRIASRGHNRLVAFCVAGTHRTSDTSSSACNVGTGVGRNARICEAPQTAMLRSFCVACAPCFGRLSFNRWQAQSLNTLCKRCCKSYWNCDVHCCFALLVLKPPARPSRHFVLYHSRCGALQIMISLAQPSCHFVRVGSLSLWRGPALIFADSQRSFCEDLA